MPMLAELVDAVVGVDTHRDTHQVEIADPNGVPIATCSITNDTTGYAQLLAWIVDHAPGPRLVVSIEGTRSYGLGLTRAITAAGLDVVECGQPNRRARRAKGKSDAIDAHLAVLAALQLDADRLPTPRADGDREALRILLSARNELTTVSTAQTNRLRALLLTGEDPDRHPPRPQLHEALLLRPGTEQQSWSHAASENPEGSTQTVVNGSDLHGHRLPARRHRQPRCDPRDRRRQLQPRGHRGEQDHLAELRRGVGEAVAGVVSVQTKSGTTTSSARCSSSRSATGSRPATRSVARHPGRCHPAFTGRCCRRRRGTSSAPR